MADKRTQSDRESCGESTTKRIRPSDTRRICPHCAESVSERTFYRHKRLYYSSSTKMWQTEARKDRKEPETWSAEEFDSELYTAGSPNEAISEDASAVSIGIRYEFGFGYSACALCPHIRIHMGSNEALYSKSGKGRYTGESNQEQMMCIRVYIVRWSEQKSIY